MKSKMGLKIASCAAWTEPVFYSKHSVQYFPFIEH
jgi:hypothetical protein